ncbi:hypothetical protein K7432_006421 [Basidiobolus ranarum]|uniref:MIT domain-containing protein n=1 Tax=Basidiobolus ranarum TaxID=34480 RepID=A0ABR2WUW7_9FUNG
MSLLQKCTSFLNYITWPLRFPKVKDSASQSSIVELIEKSFENTISSTQVDQAIILSVRAVEQEQLGRRDEALCLYLKALESLLSAMPIQDDTERKKYIAQKIKEYLAHNHIDLEEKVEPTSTISDKVIQTAINLAVAIKQSPIPDAIKSIFNFALSKIRAFNQKYGIREKAWKLGKMGVERSLEIDQQYQLHQKIGEIILTGATAVIKASIAYQIATPYRELLSEARGQPESSDLSEHHCSEPHLLKIH